MKSLSRKIGVFVKSGSFYRRCLLLIVTITSLLTASIGFCMNYFGSKDIENQLNSSHEVLLQRAANNIDDSLSSLEMQVTQWALNPTFQDSLRDKTFYSDFKAYQDLNKTLMAMQNSLPLIDHTYIFLNNPPVIISDEQGYIELHDSKTIEQYSTSLKGPSLAWQENFTGYNDASSNAVALIDTLPVGGSQRYGAVIVTINSAAIDTMINQTAADNESTAFIMKSNGDLLTSGCSGQGCGLQDSIRTEILQRTPASQSFDLYWKGEKYAVSDRILQRAGTSWTLVTATPLTKLTQPVTVYSKVNLAISLLGIVAAILLSWFASNRIYRPWRELRDESSSLRDQLNQSVHSLREGFMMQLVQGYYYALSEEELGSRMQNLGWTISQRKFIVLHVQLTGLSYANGRFSKGDEQLVTFSAGNIMEDLFGEHWIEAKVANFQDLTLYAWISLPASLANEQIHEQVRKLCETVVERVHRILYVDVSIVIGRICSTVKQIADTAVESREAIRYRDLHKVSQIIHVDDFLRKSTPSFQYPHSLEQEVIQAFRSGDEPRAALLVQQFLAE
ncbi:MAG: transcriptional regulator, partial [Bacilli bacterium]|nr:transcriptional regulator [Bacilli bacterium]